MNARLVLRAARSAAALTLVAACGSPVGPSPLTAVTATPVPAGVLVEWTGGDGASGFVVHRTADGQGRQELARVPGEARSYLDHTAAEGVAYVYAVAALGRGPGDPVSQAGGPVSPLPGVRLTVGVDGAGAALAETPYGEVRCTSDCVVGLPPGGEVVLRAEDGAAAYAGYSAPCPPAPVCRLSADQDAAVTALFRPHVLRLTLDGDAPVTVQVSPPDDRGLAACDLRPETPCLLGYSYDGDALKVSVNAGLLEPNDGRLVGLSGACAAEAGYCVADVSGPSLVRVRSARTPLARPDSFRVRADAPTVVAAPGVLANDDFGTTARAELVSFDSQGHLELGPDGSFSYDPGSGHGSTARFSYLVRGAHGVAGEPAAVRLTLVPRPRGQADAYTTREDEALTLPAPGVAANDTVPEGTTVELVSADDHGELELRADGALVFRPGRDDVRPFRFAYRLRNDVGALSDPVEVTIAVTPVNDPPRFELTRSQVTARRGQEVVVPGFATGVSPGGGPDEAGQDLVFLVSRRSGPPLRFSRAPFVSRDGTLVLTPHPLVYRPGTATYEVTLLDSGGTAEGGVDRYTLTFELVLLPDG